MIQTLYPYLDERDLPDYGYIGKVAKKLGGGGLLASRLWAASVYQPQGDILAYVQRMSNSMGGTNGKNSSNQPTSGGGRDNGKRKGVWSAEEIAAANQEPATS
jgi:hypothetical protein